jgi:tripartite-type tricarboxylate transporter receptor subunit TctC
MPAQNLNELVAWLKANPNLASAGTIAAGQRLASAFFRKETGTQFTFVPYGGESAAMQDLIAGQIDLLFYSLDSLPLARSGSIKAYAVTGDTRSVLAPDGRCCRHPRARWTRLARLVRPTLPLIGGATAVRQATDHQYGAAA